MSIFTFALRVQPINFNTRKGVSQTNRTKIIWVPGEREREKETELEFLFFPCSLHFHHLPGWSPTPAHWIFANIFKRGRRRRDREVRGSKRRFVKPVAPKFTETVCWVSLIFSQNDSASNSLKKEREREKVRNVSKRISNMKRKNSCYLTCLLFLAQKIVQRIINQELTGIRNETKRVQTRGNFPCGSVEISELG